MLKGGESRTSIFVDLSRSLGLAEACSQVVPPYLLWVIVSARVLKIRFLVSACSLRFIDCWLV